MMIFYSHSQNMFFDGSLKKAYTQGSGWPDDAISVSDKLFVEFIQQPPEGKTRVAGPDGLPRWADIPPLTDKELAASAEIEKQRLISVANTKIAPLADAVDLGIATEDEQRLYNDWRRYRVLLNRVDTTAIPVTWPNQPE